MFRQSPTRDEVGARNGSGRPIRRIALVADCVPRGTYVTHLQVGLSQQLAKLTRNKSFERNTRLGFGPASSRAIGAVRRRDEAAGEGSVSRFGSLIENQNP